MLRFQNILKVLIVAAIIILPWLVSAQFPNQNQNLNLNEPPQSPIQSFADLYKFLQRVLKAVWAIFFVVAAIFIVLAAFSYLTAGGDQEKVSKAKKQFMYAIVAIVIALVAVGIDNIVKSVMPSETDPGTGRR